MNVDMIVERVILGFFACFLVVGVGFFVLLTCSDLQVLLHVLEFVGTLVILVPLFYFVGKFVLKHNLL